MSDNNELKDLGNLDWGIATYTVFGLVKSSGKSMEEVATCAGTTRQTLYRMFDSGSRPLMMVRILECLGYEAKIVIETKIPKGEG